MELSSSKLIAINLLDSYYPTFCPVSPIKYMDVISIVNGIPSKILIRVSHVPRPLFSLNLRVPDSGEKGFFVEGNFDYLFAYHELTQQTWLIPFSDLPNVQSIQLGKKYDSYLLSGSYCEPVETHKTAKEVKDEIDETSRAKREIVKQMSLEEDVKVEEMLDL